MKPADNNNHAKLLERLRLDPRFIELQDKAIANPDNRKDYVLEARKLFNLSPSWSQFLDWYLAYPKLKLPMTGTSYWPYTDPVTGKRYYMIPVEPETTLDNVKRAYSNIKQQYKEAGISIDLRQIDLTQTALEVTAYRLNEDGMSNKQIFEKLEEKFPDLVFTKDEIPIFIRSGKEKSMS